MILPDDCKDHCVYKEVGATDDKHWCFGMGNLTTKCLAQGEPEECKNSEVFVAPAMTGKKDYLEIIYSKHYPRSNFNGKNRTGRACLWTME